MLKKVIRNLAVCSLIVLGVTPAAAQVVFRKGNHQCRGHNQQERGFLDAIGRGNLEVVRGYLQQGVGPNTKDDCDIPALTYATQSHHLDVLKELVVSGANVNAVDDFQRDPPLIWLIDAYGTETGDSNETTVYEAVKFLVNNGADVNAKGRSDQPALTLAVLNNMQKVVELLIANGAKIDAKDGDDRTAYSHAAEMGNVKLKSLLVSAGANRDIGVEDYRRQYGAVAFIQAAADGRTDIVEAMLAEGTNVNFVNDAKVSALMRATNESTVEVLLAAGADVNLKDDHGFTALAWAAFFGQVDYVKKLIAVGANVNSVVYDGSTILDLAKPEVKPILLAAGARQH